MFLFYIGDLISHSAAQKMDCIASVNLNTRTIHDSWQDVAVLLPKELTQRFKGVNVIDKSNTTEAGKHVFLLFHVYEEHFYQIFSPKLEFSIWSIISTPIQKTVSTLM